MTGIDLAQALQSLGAFGQPEIMVLTTSPGDGTTSRLQAIVPKCLVLSLYALTTADFEGEGHVRGGKVVQVEPLMQKDVKKNEVLVLDGWSQCLSDVRYGAIRWAIRWAKAGKAVIFTEVEPRLLIERLRPLIDEDGNVGLVWHRGPADESETG